MKQISKEDKKAKKLADKQERKEAKKELRSWNEMLKRHQKALIYETDLP